MPLDVSVSYAAEFGNSKSVEESTERRREGSLKQISNSAIASLFTYAMQPEAAQASLSDDFKKAVNKLTGEAGAFAFVQKYGTHYIEKAKMGARFEQNMYFSIEATEE